MGRSAALPSLTIFVTPRKWFLGYATCFFAELNGVHYGRLKVSPARMAKRLLKVTGERKAWPSQLDARVTGVA